MHHMPLIKTAASLGLGKVRLRVGAGGWGLEGGGQRKRNKRVQGMKVDKEKGR